MRKAPRLTVVAVAGAVDAHRLPQAGIQRLGLDLKFRKRRRGMGLGGALGLHHLVSVVQVVIVVAQSVACEKIYELYI